MNTRLVRQDILELEPRLCESLSRLLPFESHAVYFPQDNLPEAPVWLPEEHKVLLPLWRENELLGVFMARHANDHIVEALLPSLPGVISLCLDNLQLFKAGRMDALTGLAVKQVLIDRITREAAVICAPFERNPEGSLAGEEDPPHSGTMGLIIVRFRGLQTIAAQSSHGFAEKFCARLAEIFLHVLPDGAMGAHTGDYEFAAFIPGADRAKCDQVAGETVRALGEVRLTDPLTNRAMGVLPHAGYALYPQDLDGIRTQDRHEPAPLLLHKAGLAADVVAALNRLRPSSTGQVMGYGRLLHEGGVIRKILPLSRVQTNLGRGVGAREGQRFSVWSVRYPVQGETDGECRPLYKGELVLLEVRESDSVAEVLHLGDPAWPLELEDTLALLPEERGLPPRSPADENAPRTDPLTGLHRHGEFLAHLARAREGCKRFSLVLLHVDLTTFRGNNQGPNSPAQHPQTSEQAFQAEHVMGELAELCRHHFKTLEGDVLGGRFALNSLIFFHPHAETGQLTAEYTALCREAALRFGRVGAGIAGWPFLDFRMADMLECSRKALEYALLLPEPHVGVFDSLALNISADKHHCRGDLFGAIEEYKLALLADPNNALAWNSLGVCMATLGHHNEARRHFEEALRRTPDDPALAYNLGAVCQNLNDDTAASKHFLACLALAPSHLYSMVRLGQLAENRGDLDEAHTRYENAAGFDGQSALPYRHLARLALKRGEPDLAREHLHKALLRNPRDAVALGLMAQLYLDGGEDPALAETLARQSVALQPGRKSGWLQLARALEAQGQRNESREALLKAGEL